MGGEENLIPMSKRSKEEVREIARRGGKKSGETRRRKKTMKEAAQLLLELSPPAKIKASTKAFCPDDNINNQTALLVSMLKEALNGNVKAAVFIRDTAGENPDRGDSRDAPKENNLLEVIDKSLKGLDDDI